MASSDDMEFGTRFAPPSEPSLCQNGCGFFGTAATKGLCSKCYRDLCAMEEQTRSAMEKLTTMPVTNLRVRTDPVVRSSGSEASPPPAPRASNRCWSCKKKVGLLGFNCRCGYTYCGSHRYPEMHGCSFDFKGQGRDEIGKANPLIKPDKFQRV